MITRGPHVDQCFHQPEGQVGGVVVDGPGSPAELEVVQAQPLPVQPERSQPGLPELGKQVERAQVPGAGEQLRAVEDRERMQSPARWQAQVSLGELLGEPQRGVTVWCSRAERMSSLVLK